MANTEYALQPTKPSTTGKRITKWSRRQDAHRQSVTDAPTPEKFTAYLDNIDDGDLGLMLEMSEEMESKDPFLHGVARTRRAAVLALDWEIVPKESNDDQDFADEVAEFCREQLEEIAGCFTDALTHLASAIGPNLAVLENIWQSSRLVDIVTVPGHRLNQDLNTSPEVLLLTDDNTYPGEQLPPWKFVVHTPHGRGPQPFKNTPFRAGCWLWLFKSMARSDWSAFTELFGIPMRVATMPEKGATEGVQERMIQLMRDLADDTWAVLPNGAKVEFLQLSGQNAPHQEFLEWGQRQQSVLWIGQTLTTEHGSVGSLALGEVHQNVRTDILLADLQAEARTVRSGILEPMAKLRWGSRKRVPVPQFRRIVHEAKDIEGDRILMDKITMARDMGLTIDPDWLHDALGVPRPKPEVVDSEEDLPTEE